MSTQYYGKDGPGRNKPEDKFEHAKSNAKAWLASIAQMLERLETAEEQAKDGPDETDAPRREINESILSILVRDGWRQPGGSAEGAEEYEILLTTGGPALRIRGELNEYDEPANAVLEIQDWFTPWTEYGPTFGLTDEQSEQLLTFAQHFYFGG